MCVQEGGHLVVKQCSPINAIMCSSHLCLSSCFPCVPVCVRCVQVSEQVDSLRVLFTDPVDYLVTPRVLASMIAGPILNVLCFCMGEWGWRAAGLACFAPGGVGPPTQDRTASGVQLCAFCGCWLTSA